MPGQLHSCERRCFLSRIWRTQCSCSPAAEAKTRARFEQFWSQTADRLFRLVRNRVEHCQDAEDIFANVQFKAYANFRAIESKDNPFLYMCTITLNEVRSFYRRNQVSTVPLDEPECCRKAVDTASLPEVLVLQGECEAQVWTAIQRLPRDLREILIKNQFDGLTYREIAQERQVSRNTVASSLLRARSLMREYLEKESSDDEL